MAQDLTARLPNGEFFEFWEKEQTYERELHVACENPAQFGDSACKAAMAYTFPSFAARNGMNHVRTKGQKDSDSTLVWCEVVVD